MVRYCSLRGRWKIRAGITVCLLLTGLLGIAIHSTMSQHDSLRFTDSQLFPKLGSNPQGHLNVQRRDLDASQYNSRKQSPEGTKSRQAKSTSEGATSLHKRQESDPMMIPDTEGGGVMNDSEVLSHLMPVILRDGSFKSLDKLNKLLEAAEILRSDVANFNDSLQSMSDRNPIVKTKFNNGKQIEAIHMPKLADVEIERINTALKKTPKKSKRRKNTKGTPQYTAKAGKSFRNLTGWQRFHNGISQDELYKKDDSHVIKQVLHDLVNQPIIKATEREDGTQLKVMLTFANGGRALFKPLRFPREQADTWPNHYYFSDFERHFSEIATFHLDRLLGYRRTPPVAGRFVNLIDFENVANKKLKKTFFTSPIGNRCFFGTCDYYCKSGHAACGSPNLLEGSVAQYLPSNNDVSRNEIENPWIRSYSKHGVKSDWETDNNYCKRVRYVAPYNKGRLFLDVIDLHVLDFLIGNMDRHHYETFTRYNNDTYPINLDNGRGFGKSHHDEMSILAPLYQCCAIRKSTLARLMQFNTGPTSLSAAMKASMRNDAAAPVLLDKHLEALDRRVVLILKEVLKCLAKKNTPTINAVIIDDGL